MYETEDIEFAQRWAQQTTGCVIVDKLLDGGGSTHCKEILGDRLIVLGERRLSLMNVLHLTQYEKHFLIAWNFNF